MFFSRLAVNTLLQNRRQYVSLFSVCLVGVAIMFFAVFVTDGMLRSVYQKARQYYGGNLVFSRGSKRLAIADADGAVSIMRDLVPDSVGIFSRIEYDASDSLLFFEGLSVRQRMFKGVDFDSERELFSQFTFIDGAALSSPEHNTVIISKAMAERLDVRVGDLVTLQVATDDGYINTAQLQVSGIFLDSSLFGMYTTYLDISSLRQIAALSEDFVNRICFYYRNGSPAKKEIRRLYAALKQHFTMYELGEDRSAFSDADDGQPVYGLVRLDDNIKDLRLLIDAIRVVVTLVIIILVAIISIGMGSTYRVIVMKRVTEIGIYRALGMKPAGVKRLFVLESLYLLAAGFVCGLLLTMLAGLVLTRFNFSFIPAFDIFLIDGHLRPVFTLPKSVGLFCVITVTIILSMLFTVRNVVHISPVGALATTT